MLGNGISHLKHPKFGKCREYTFKNSIKNESLTVYYVNDYRGQFDLRYYKKYICFDIGILKTKTFYFFFDGKCCFNEKNNTLCFDGLKGLMALSHGTRLTSAKYQLFKEFLRPVTPPVGDWNIYWKGAHGSSLILNANEYELTDKLFGYWKRTSSSSEVGYYTTSRSAFPINSHTKSIQASIKYQNPQKMVTGIISNKNRIMNYQLTSMKERNKQHFNNCIGIVQSCKNMCHVYTRNRRMISITFYNLLTEIAKYNFPRKVVACFCRSLRKGSPSWDVEYNVGPSAADLFSLTLPPPLLYKPNKNYKVETVK